MSGEETERGNILIVDDQPTNLSTLFDVLNEAGFKVEVARTGAGAIAKAESETPDLILLDVLMPEMDGFETCQRLKDHELTKDIPVIFLTALDDTKDKIKGFHLGAVDYITKPIQHEEVLARVRAHLSIHHRTQKLQQQIADRARAQAELEKRVAERTEELTRVNELLKQEVQERVSAEATLQESLEKLKLTQSQLIQSEKMSAMGQRLTDIAHEINDPVNFLYGNINYIRDYVNDILNIIQLYQQEYPHPTAEIAALAEETDLEFIMKDLSDLVNTTDRAADRIIKIVRSVLRFCRVDGPKIKPANLQEGIDSTLMILDRRLNANSPNKSAIEVMKEYSPELPLVDCYSGEINHVFMSILANAIDAIEEYNHHREIAEIQANPNLIRIRTLVQDNTQVVIKIADNGPGMTEDVITCVFDPSFTTKPPGWNIGLGLSISWQIVVERHQGSLQCVSVPGEGTEFIITLPIHQPGLVQFD